MSHREIWEKLKSNKYISYTAAVLVVLLAIGFTATFYTEGSFLDSYHSPRLGDCNVDDQGNLVGGCDNQYGAVEGLPGGGSEFSGIDSNGDTVSNNFWLQIDDIEPTGDSHAPQTYWMFKQGGYLGDDVDSEDRNDFTQLHLNHGDLKWDSEVREAMESGTVCRASIEVAANSEFDYYYMENGEEIRQRYNDEDFHESGVRNVDSLMSQPVTVEANDIRITEDYMACQFDMTEIFNEGAEYTPFSRWEAWNGQEPLIAGDDWDEGSTSLDVRFGTDYDGDGLTDHDGEDECPETAGIEEKNGCPNQASKIVSVDGPRNVTVGEEVEYSVNVRNPDDDSTTISWSNGETGDSAVYSWNSTGNKSVSVTADDGFTEETEEVQISVEEKTLLGTLAEFFNGLWRILTFQG